MEDFVVRISDLPGANPLSGNELVPLVQDGVTKIRSARDIVFDGGLREHLDDSDPHAQYAFRVKNNLTATRDPIATDDSSLGYEPTSRWVNTVTSEFFICVVDTVGSANWQQATLSLDELGSAALVDVGAGNGLDSDLLDGQHGVYYRDWVNTTNKPSPTITVSGDATGSVTLDELSSGTLPLTVDKSEVEYLLRQETREKLLAETTLNLDFVKNKYEVYEGVVDGITARPFNDVLDFTRGSPATARNAIGGLDEVGIDEQRLIGNREALLIEEGRTNLFLSSEFPDGPPSVGTVVGGLVSASTMQVGSKTKTAIAVGRDGSTSSYVYGSISGISGLGVYISIFVEMGDGSEPSFGSDTNASGLNDFCLVIGGATVAPTSYGVERISGDVYLVSAYALGADGNAGVVKYATNSTKTFKITGRQIEVGDSLSSYIETVSTQVTRQADNCSRTLGQEFNPNEFTLYAEMAPLYQPVAKSGDNSQMLFVSLGSAGGVANRVQLGSTNGTALEKTVGVTITAGGDASRSFNGVSPAWEEGVYKKVAVSVSPSAVILVADGEVIYTAGTGPMPVGLDTLYIGSDFSGTQKANGLSVRQVSAEPYALTESELEVLTK